MDNKEAIAAWRARREKRLSARGMSHKDEDQWVTIKGTHVLVGENGKIKNNFSDGQAEARLGGKNMREVDKGIQKKSEPEGAEQSVGKKNNRHNEVYGPVTLSDEIKDMAVDFKDNLVSLTGDNGESANKHIGEINKTINNMLQSLKKSKEYKGSNGRLAKTDWAEPFAEEISTHLPARSTMKIGNTEYELLEKKPMGGGGYSSPVWYGNDGSAMDTATFAWKLYDHMKNGGESIEITKIGNGKAPKRAYVKKMTLEEYMDS